MKESILTRVTRRPLTSPTAAPMQEHRGDRRRPRPALALEPDRQHLRNADVEAGREVELVRDHRDEDRERDQKLHRLVAEDRADVEVGEERVGLQQAKRRSRAERTARAAPRRRSRGSGRRRRTGREARFMASLLAIARPRPPEASGSGPRPSGVRAESRPRRDRG